LARPSLVKLCLGQHVSRERFTQVNCRKRHLSKWSDPNRTAPSSTKDRSECVSSSDHGDTKLPENLDWRFKQAAKRFFVHPLQKARQKWFIQIHIERALCKPGKRLGILVWFAKRRFLNAFTAPFKAMLDVRARRTAGDHQQATGSQIDGGNVALSRHRSEEGCSSGPKASDDARSIRRIDATLGQKERFVTTSKAIRNGQVDLTVFWKYLRLRSDTNFSKMALGKIGTGAAALGMLAAASSPTLGEDMETKGQALQLASYTVEQVDCVTHVKNERALRSEAGNPMSRKDMKVMLGECRNANLDAEIAAQETYIVELDQKLASLDLKIDSNAQILDEQGRVIGQLVSVEGQLEIKRATIEELEAQLAQTEADIAKIKANIARLQADTQAKLDQAEAILRSLVV